MSKKTITLEIPEDQRLGQAIMNAFRDQWDNGYSWEVPHRKKYWDIWELDVNEIQGAINKSLKND